MARTSCTTSQKINTEVRVCALAMPAYITRQPWRSMTDLWSVTYYAYYSHSVIPCHEQKSMQHNEHQGLFIQCELHIKLASWRHQKNKMKIPLGLNFFVIVRIQKLFLSTQLNVLNENPPLNKCCWAFKLKLLRNKKISKGQLVYIIDNSFVYVFQTWMKLNSVKETKAIKILNNV